MQTFSSISLIFYHAATNRTRVCDVDVARVVAVALLHFVDMQLYGVYLVAVFVVFMQVGEFYPCAFHWESICCT